MTVTPGVLSPKFTAAVKLLGRTGARSFDMRWCGTGDDAEQPPIAWVALVEYSASRFECAAAPDPETAVLRLCERVIDGGECTHCHRPTGFDDGADDTLNQLLVPDFCWYMFDPELATFRRSCE